MKLCREKSLGPRQSFAGSKVSKVTIFPLRVANSGSEYLRHVQISVFPIQVVVAREEKLLA
jgi:hypothetical protein